ncbi:MAG: hypothetical protein ACR2QR_09510 [Woeseiaceae bacterium]
MAIKRFFYVTQDSLAVWKRERTELVEEVSFQSSDSGYELFSAYLERSESGRSLMLVDVIEEEFATDSIPELSGSDRRGLISRRLLKRFARTPYRLGTFQGKRRRAEDKYNVIFSAITNHELVDPWLAIIDKHKAPLSGITSVPLVAADLLLEFRKPAENTLFLTRHQGGRLRQVFIKSGQVVSARLSRIAPDDSGESGEMLPSEIAQSRKYLERSRLLSHTDALDVYLVANTNFAQAAFKDESGIDFQLHIIEPAEAAEKLGITGTVSELNLEVLYLARAARKSARRDYMPGNRTNYSQLLAFRHSLIALTTALAVASSIVAGAYLTRAILLRSATQTIESQITRMEETYRRENEEFEPIRADSHEMKLAVDTGDFILRNTLPIDWVMREVGSVVNDYPDVFLGQMGWEIETNAVEQNNNARRGGNDRPMPVPIPGITGVSANVNGEIRPYDGDLRRAFARIDELAARLRSDTRFDQVAVIEYPIDARPAASVSGEIRRQGDLPIASFKLSMTMRIDNEAS